MMELKNMEESVGELSKVEAGNEILLPICSGVFVKAKIQDTNELFVNVGSDVTVKKDNKSVQKMIADQIEEISQYKEEINQQMSQIHEQSGLIEKEIQSRAK